MSAPEMIGLAADADALNLADEVRRILADGQPRTTRQVADLSRLTQGGDDVSKTIYLLRMRGELQTDVVDGARVHRLIPGGGPPAREPAVPRRRAPSARGRSSREDAPQGSARGRASREDPRGSGAPPRMPGDEAPQPATADDVYMSIDDRGRLILTSRDCNVIVLDARLARRLRMFLDAAEPLLDYLAQAAP